MIFVKQKPQLIARFCEWGVWAMSKMNDFVSREIKLRSQMTFGEWIRHIRHSHDELLSLLVRIARFVVESNYPAIDISEASTKPRNPSRFFSDLADE